MDKSLFLMISALTSNLHQDHSGRPVRLHIKSSPELKFVVVLEHRSRFGGESQRKQVRGGLTDIEKDFNERLAEWS